MYFAPEPLSLRGDSALKCSSAESQPNGASFFQSQRLPCAGKILAIWIMITTLWKIMSGKTKICDRMSFGPWKGRESQVLWIPLRVSPQARVHANPPDDFKVAWTAWGHGWDWGVMKSPVMKSHALQPHYQLTALVFGGCLCAFFASGNRRCESGQYHRRGRNRCTAWLYLGTPEEHPAPSIP